MKYLLIISKNYWGAEKSEETAINFMNLFSKYLNIPAQNINILIGQNVNVNSVKKYLYNFINSNYVLNNIEHKFYIYINGHGNQIQDTNNDEKITILEKETQKDCMDEIYHLPDGHIVDDEITSILINAIKDKQRITNDIKIIKPFVFLISDHCSSGSMIDNIEKEDDKVFNWISIGSSLDNQDSLMTGDGNVMTCNLLNLLNKLNTNESLIKINADEFNDLLQKEMKESFVGDLQTATFHISDNNMLLYKLFE